MTRPPQYRGAVIKCYRSLMQPHIPMHHGSCYGGWRATQQMGVFQQPGGAFRAALKEALIILFSAFFLGSVYSSVMHKGLFGRPPLPKPASLSKPAGSPEAITVGEAEKYHSTGKALFIDTRSDSIYRAGHIEGAINIQLSQIEGEIDFLKEISSEKILIVYCDGSACHSSIEFSSRLLSCGVTNIRVFFGGWEEWSAARLPTVRDRP